MPNDCISREEGKLRSNREFVGYIDEDKLPKCKNLYSDTNLLPVRSKRLAFFVKALRKVTKE